MYPRTNLLISYPLAKNFSWFYDCPGPPPGSMITDNAPGHPWTTPGPLLYTKSWCRSAKVVQSGSRWSIVVQSGPESTRRQKQLFNFFADAGHTAFCSSNLSQSWWL